MNFQLSQTCTVKLYCLLGVHKFLSSLSLIDSFPLLVFHFLLKLPNLLQERLCHQPFGQNVLVVGFNHLRKAFVFLKRKLLWCFLAELNRPGFGVCLRLLHEFVNGVTSATQERCLRFQRLNFLFLGTFMNLCNVSQPLFLVLLTVGACAGNSKPLTPNFTCSLKHWFNISWSV